MGAVRVCALAQLAQREPLRVELPSIDLALVRDGERVYAIEDVCSHAEVALSDGDVEVEAGVCTIECAYHGSRFSLADGEPTGPPASAPVPVFPVEVIGGIVYVELEND